MAHRDYAAGTHLRPIMVNITFDSNLQIAEVGIGYHVVTPSGRHHDSGYTWHRPQTGERGPDEHVAALQAAMDALIRAAAAHEGVELRGAVSDRATRAGLTG